MANAIDLTGQKFGKLTVIKRVENYVSPKGKKWAKFLCQCECGNQTCVRGTDLKNGSTKTCGCSVGSEQRLNHGKSETHLYKTWGRMKERCYNKNNRNYHNYGGRGIIVCDEWKHNFLNFYKWAINNGYNKNLSIDRINVNGNYCPENCRWATPKEQGRNKRNNKLITFNGETHCLTEWAESANISLNCLRKRLIFYKWDFEKAITTPPETKFNKKK